MNLPGRITPIDVAGVVLILAAITGTYFLGIQKKASELDRIADEHRKMREAIVANETLADREARMNENLELLTAALEDYERQMPPEPKLDDFIGQLHEVARAKSVELASVRPGEPVERERYAVLPLQVRADASFAELYEFLYAMSQVPRINKLDRISVHRSGGNGLSVDLTLHIFMAKAAA